MHGPKAKAWNAIAEKTVQAMPRESWWVTASGMLDPEKRAEAAERMSVTTQTVWQKADGDNRD